MNPAAAMTAWADRPARQTHLLLWAILTTITWVVLLWAAPHIGAVSVVLFYAAPAVIDYSIRRARRILTRSAPTAPPTSEDA